MFYLILVVWEHKIWKWIFSLGVKIIEFIILKIMKHETEILRFFVARFFHAMYGYFTQL